MQRTEHFHILDNADGDWGAHDSRIDAKAAMLEQIRESAEVYDEPLQRDEMSVVPSADWCAQNEEACYHDRNAALDRTIHQTPEWTHRYAEQPAPVYRIDGRRVPRWKMISRLSTYQMATLWPAEGHPVALPQWRYDVMIMDPRTCPCATRAHRKKGCAIGPAGRKCSTCGALYTEWGNAMSHCPPCDEWADLRSRYLADSAAAALEGGSSSQQLALL